MRGIAEMVKSRPRSFAVLFPDTSRAGGGWGGSGVEGEIIKALGVFFWFSFKRLRGS